MIVKVEVTCPKCGEKFLADCLVNGLGRKPREVPVEIVLNALQTDSSGAPQFDETAKKISELYGIFVDRGLVYNRLMKEAERQGITMLELGRKKRDEQREKSAPSKGRRSKPLQRRQVNDR